jgi:trehalose 6-phosphate synthase
VSRIVAVSNRVADSRQASAGGLAVGVLGALKNQGGIWFGWNGELTKDEPGEADVRTRQGITYATIALNEQQFERYYNGFCNNALWPLLHYRLGLSKFDREQFESYMAVSEVFAARLRPLLRSDDLVWVHDFHLIPLAARMRAAGAKQPFGFFLHTPFPPLEVLRALPVHMQLLRDMCSYDVVGFQTERDLRAFRDAASMAGIGVAALPDGTLQRGDHTIKTAAFPIGIDVAACAERAVAHRHVRQVQSVQASLQGRKLMIGVDRLDYSKGLPERFGAYQTFLDRHPAFRGDVVFMQIAAPTRMGVRAYAEIRHDLERMAGHINGTFADVDWVPLRYLNRSVDRGTLMAIFRVARAGLVTPLRDGMNLVAKEYVAAQDPEDPGVLVLSMLAGAAEELHAAVLVNPHDSEGVADGIETALTMPLDERRARHAAMLEMLRRNDIDRWRERFIGALRESAGASVSEERRAAPVSDGSPPRVALSLSDPPRQRHST